MVTARLAAEEWRGGKPVSTNQVVVECPTSYEYLRRFSDHLHLILNGKIDQARLDFDQLL
ncbi:MAG: hypothetical protein R2707_07720 [Acidimicrobiales bacterium]